MKNHRHGLSIGIERAGEKVFLSLKASGKLTHQDYQIITPMIDGALAEVKEPAVDVIIDGTELEGWEVRAAWDDFKLGLKHGNKFHRIAIFGNRRWQQSLSVMAGWFISGEVKYFESPDAAKNWIEE